MSVETAGFTMVDKCACCEEQMTTTSKCIVIVKWPNGGTDTLCLECYRITTQSAIAWLSYVGDLPSESAQERQDRGRRQAKRQRRLTLLEMTDD